MALRLIELTSENPIDITRPDLAEKLDIIDYWTEKMDSGLNTVRVLVKAEETETLMDILEDKWGKSPEFRIIVYKIEATLPFPEPEGAEEIFEEIQENENPKRVACAELVQRLSDQVALDKIYFITVTLSTIVAAMGLIQGSTATIIGAMVIAPFLSPNMMLSLATAIGDTKLARKALIVTGAGVISALIISILVGIVVPFDYTVPVIRSRTEINLADIIIAFAAGSAGSLAFTTGLSASLVGVMVAVALLPPLVVAGLFLGTGKWWLASKALLLLSTNIVGINLSGIATFLFQGIRPNYWWEEEKAKKMVNRAIITWLLLLVLLILLIYIAR